VPHLLSKPLELADVVSTAENTVPNPSDGGGGRLEGIPAVNVRARFRKRISLLKVNIKKGSIIGKSAGGAIKAVPDRIVE
jgi:hypothetical protein